MAPKSPLKSVWFATLWFPRRATDSTLRATALPAFCSSTCSISASKVSRRLTPEYLKGHKQNVNCLKYFEIHGRLFSGSWDGTVICWNARKKSHRILRVFRDHSNWVCAFARDPHLLHLYSIGHDHKIIQYNVKKLQKLAEFGGFGTKGYRGSFCVSELTDRIFGIDAVCGSLVRVLDLGRRKVDLLRGSRTPILSLIKSDSKKVLYALSKDNTILIWDLFTRRIRKTLKNIHKFDIETFNLSNRGNLFVGSSDDKMKIVFQDSIVRTFDLMNAESSIDTIEISQNSRYIYAGCDNQKIIILKEIGMLITGSSGSSSFESLRTLSSNDLEKKKDSLVLSKEGLQKVIYGGGAKKRKTLNAPTSRKSSFSNSKKLLSKGSYEFRYQTLHSDSFNIHSRKSKNDMLRLEPLKSICEKIEKIKSPPKSKKVKESHKNNLLGFTDTSKRLR